MELEGHDKFTLHEFNNTYEADFWFYVYFSRSVTMQVDKQHYTDKLRNYVLKLVSNMKTAITATIESELQRLLKDTIPYTEDSTWKLNRQPNNL